MISTALETVLEKTERVPAHTEGPVNANFGLDTGNHRGRVVPVVGSDARTSTPANRRSANDTKSEKLCYIYVEPIPPGGSFPGPTDSKATPDILRINTIILHSIQFVKQINLEKNL